MSKKLSKVKSISVKTSEYTKDWETKWNYFQVWRVMVRDDGTESIVLEDVVKNYLKPLLWEKFEGWLNVYSKKEETVDDWAGEMLPF